MRWFACYEHIIIFLFVFLLTALLHVCSFCGVRFSSENTLYAHQTFYCTKKPVIIPGSLATPMDTALPLPRASPPVLTMEGTIEENQIEVTDEMKKPKKGYYLIQ